MAPVPLMAPALAVQINVGVVAEVEAVNCCVPPAESVVESGLMVSVGGAVVVTVTMQMADLVLSATLVAVRL